MHNNIYALVIINQLNQAFMQMNWCCHARLYTGNYLYSHSERPLVIEYILKLFDKFSSNTKAPTEYLPKYSALFFLIVCSKHKNQKIINVAWHQKKSRKSHFLTLFINLENEKGFERVAWA